MGTALPDIIAVDKEKCVGCHACIAACPVKYCNDGSTDVVTVNNDLCIGCGNCIRACTHSARLFLDDCSAFLRDCGKVPMVAIVAPSVAANFPDQYLRLNSYLRQIGIDAVFDVSFGAELTVRSYLEHITKNQPDMVIAQPCPAIVTYIQIYQPELLPYLAPADSPMLHTIKMIREFYKEYANHRIAVISPCIAKRREFAECGQGNYNVTYKNLCAHLDKNDIHLMSFEERDYDNPPSERAVLFSTPGGLLQTVLREKYNAATFTRKIEGVPHIYDYFKKLPASFSRGTNPLLVDCLNCELGCNGGTGTLSRDASPDDLESLVEARNRSMRKHYKSDRTANGRRVPSLLLKTLDRYWKPGLYTREYLNLSRLNTIRYPDERELQAIYISMNKFSPKDIYNCGACGYGTCEGMATALHNKLNTTYHCLHNQHTLLDKHNTGVTEAVKSLTSMVYGIENRSSRISINSANVASAARQISASVGTVSLSVTDAQEVMSSINKAIDGLKHTIQEIALNSEKTHQMTSGAVVEVGIIQRNVDNLGDASTAISGIIDTIIEIAEQTKLLALNATIEAARAGDAGKGFAVVASEVKELARQTNQATVDIKEKITNMVHSTGTTIGGIRQIGQVIDEINKYVYSIAAAVEEQSIVTRNIAENVSRNALGIDGIATNVAASAKGTEEIARNISEVNIEIAEIAHSVKLLNRQSQELDELAGCHVNPQTGQ